MTTTTRPASRRGRPAPAGAPASRRGPGTAAHRLATVAVPLLGLVAVAVLPAFVVGPVQVGSAGMEPTLRPGDVVLVDRRRVDVDHLGRGDLVTSGHPGTGAEIVKRVVGLPGDLVTQVGGMVLVDGRPVPGPTGEPTRGPDGARGTGPRLPVRVPDGAVYLLGDSRSDSVDSRHYGPVPETDLAGRVLVRVWPPHGTRALDPQPAARTDGPGQTLKRNSTTSPSAIT